MPVRSPLFSQGFFRHLVLQQRVSQQPLEPPVFAFQLLQPLGVGHAHPAKLAAPQVIAGLRESVPAAQLGHRQPRFRLPQEANDLLFCKSLLHVQSPVYGIGLQNYLLLKSGGTSSHYLYEAEFCNPAAGWEKGQIEKNVQDSRHRVWHKAPVFESLAALNTWLEQRCVALWHELMHPEQPGRTVSEVWADEQPQLMKLPRPFDGFVEHTKRVSPTCLIHFERNRYSVPASYANRPVSLRVYADRLVVATEGQIIAEHKRVILRSHSAGCTVYDWRHYLSVLQRKPGALRNGAPFAELPEGFKRLQALLLKRSGGDREMVEILALVLHHNEQAVLAAVELALESGAASKQHVLNLLARLIGADAPTPVDAPPALTLVVEPQADVSRYDRLRSVRDAA